MTCFWSAILQTLNHQDRQLLQIGSSAREVDVVTAIKKWITDTDTNTDRDTYITHRKSIFSRVLWQGHSFSPKFISECYEWIKDYNIHGIYGGHLTSSCDPFLLFLCGFLGWNIKFHYQRTLIQISNTNNSQPKRNVQFGGNSHHFYRV